MLKLTIPSVDMWDEVNQEFVSTKEQTIELEHSLVSLSKWESKWCKPFLSKDPKTTEEIIDYIQCMTLTRNVNPEVYSGLTKDNMEAINAYIDAPMTATKIRESKGSRAGREQLTAELIYYYMIALTIPFECQKWHLNRLLMLIRVCSEKNQPPKKMSRRELASRNAALNASRRSKLNSRG